MDSGHRWWIGVLVIVLAGMGWAEPDADRHGDVRFRDDSFRDIPASQDEGHGRRWYVVLLRRGCWCCSAHHTWSKSWKLVFLLIGLATSPSRLHKHADENGYTYEGIPLKCHEPSRAPWGEPTKYALSLAFNYQRIQLPAFIGLHGIKLAIWMISWNQWTPCQDRFQAYSNSRHLSRYLFFVEGLTGSR